MRTTFAHTKGVMQTKRVVAMLIEHSQWFQVEPQPCDVYEITVKEENGGRLETFISASRLKPRGRK